MSIPPERAWLIPIVLPFIIGLLVGVMVKKGLRLLIADVALIIVLAVTGILSLTFPGLFVEAMKFLPKLYDSGQRMAKCLTLLFRSILDRPRDGISVCVELSKHEPGMSHPRPKIQT